MNVPWTFLTLIFTSVLSICYYLWQKWNYWHRQNVQLISLREFIKKARQKSLAYVFHEYYQEMHKADVALKAMEMPLFSVVIVQDVQAIKDIMRTHYESFPDRGFYVNPRDPFTTGLPRLEYNEWKPIRKHLSPIFTPAKTKGMFPVVLEISERLVDLLKQKCLNEKGSELEVYDLCARYTTDITGQLIFGIEAHCLRGAQSDFRKYGDQGFKQHGNPWKNILGYKFPKLMRFLNIKIFDEESTEFFTRLVKDCMEYRQRNNIKGNDVIDILIDMKRENDASGDLSMSFKSLAGQAHSFYLGGFETAACSMSYALFELAKNHKMQNKVRQEINNVLAQNDGKLTYDSLKDMRYLNQIMLETLRKYPIVPFMPRICRRSCTINTSQGPVTIKPETHVIIPFYGVHHNPIYYPQPDEFRPERFTEEEIEKRPICSYLPFGDGPKYCIGELLGKMQITIGLAMLLSNFQLSQLDKNPVEELKFDPKNVFLLFVNDGIHLKVEKL